MGCRLDSEFPASSDPVVYNVLGETRGRNQSNLCRKKRRGVLSLLLAFQRPGVEIPVA